MRNKIRRATIMGLYTAVAIAIGGCQIQPAGAPCDDGLCPEGWKCVQPSNSDLLGTQRICVILEVCGNGLQEQGEECDDGAQNADSGRCRTDCHLSKCGDGYVDPPDEECDDGPGNGNNKDCRSDCIINRCGDGYVDTYSTLNHEDCDGAPQATRGAGNAIPTETADCNLDCTMSICGDGKVNQAAREDCDDGHDNGDDRGVARNSRCNSDCTFARCGDNKINPEFKPDGVKPEVCDKVDPTTHASLNGVPCDYGDPFCVRCNATCTDNVSPGGPFCGDGIKQTAFGEQCDPATGPAAILSNPSLVAKADSATCDFDCTPVVCGDGHINEVAGESCDDGNKSACGTCPATDCKKATTVTAAQATATITTSAGDRIADGNHFTLDDGFGTTLTFEYTTGSTTIPGAVPIPFVRSPMADGAVTIASNTVTAINSQQPGFGITASVTFGGTTVTLTNTRKSVLGNRSITFSGLPGFVFAPVIGGTLRMDGGAAGDCGAGIGCVSGDDCASGTCDPTTNRCR